ncbi:MAG: hypothetical protein ACI8ZF_000844 [Candidatus Midichloriaceae bacterium]|jgi:hypothetical protein
MIIVNPIYASGVSSLRKVEKNTDKNSAKGSKKFTLNTTESKPKSSVSEESIISDNLFCMQEGFEERKEKKGQKYGEKILGLLSEYRLKVISGDVSLRDLHEIKELISVFMLSGIDDKVKNVIEEIELLASVELAKRGVI